MALAKAVRWIYCESRFPTNDALRTAVFEEMSLDLKKGVAMKDAIGYLRVSTQEQGRRGLGLSAQRLEIDAFGAREGFSIQWCYQDIQTGAGCARACGSTPRSAH